MVALTASTVLVEVGPGAAGQTLPDLGPHNHAASPADVLNLIVDGENLHTSNLENTETIKCDMRHIEK